MCSITPKLLQLCYSPLLARCLFQVSPTPSEVLIRLIGSRDTVREAADSIIAMGKSHQNALASVKITTSTCVR